MTNLVEQLKLIEKAQEDIYFARIDRELIDALHAKPDGKRTRKEDAGQRDHEIESVSQRRNQ